jgi:hypothetical protein
VKLVTDVTRFPTSPDLEIKHCLLNRVEKLGFRKMDNVFSVTQYMWENASHASHLPPVAAKPRAKMRLF